MIAVKSGSVLLAVSALAVLVQSSGVPDGDPGEIEADREVCIGRFINRLTQFTIGRGLMELVEFSRSHYRGSFNNLLKRRNPRYEAAMSTIPFPLQDCYNILRLEGDLHDDPECGRYIQDERERESFVLDLVELSVEAKTRLEAIQACYYAGGRPSNEDFTRIII